MTTFLQQAIQQFAASGNRCEGSSANGEKPGDFPAGVVISLNPSGSIESDLAREGYTNARSFLTLPSFGSPRWLFPLGNGRCTLAGLEIYKPYATAARMFKGLLKAVAVARCQGVARHRVLLASRGPLPLEDLVREVTGECQPVFALSVGTEARYRKVTIQVMRREGEILGYIKLPLTPAAVERVHHEADTLSRLWSFPALRAHIPRVLYSGPWGDGAILFQSPGPPQPGPVNFNSHYEAFLRLLWGVQPAEKPGPLLREEVAARWHMAEPGVSSGWRALGEAALAKAKRELEDVTIPCGVSHGDFAPWNARVGDHGVYVFDWESASWDAPVLWDVFHFKTQVAASLGKNHDLDISRDRRSGERASFLLYLLSSACQLFGERSPKLGLGLEYRLHLLAKHLGGY